MKAEEKRVKRNPETELRKAKSEFQLVGKYYQATVWNFIKGRILVEPFYNVAWLAWNRYHKAARKYPECQLLAGNRPECNLLAELDKLKPQCLVRKEAPAAIDLAKVASCLLKKTTESHEQALKSALQLWIAAKQHVDGLPETLDGFGQSLRMEVNPITFKDILASNTSYENGFPLMPPVKPGRNSGQLSKRALLKELKLGLSSNEYKEAIENHALTPCQVEEIRWRRWYRNVGQ